MVVLWGSVVVYSSQNVASSDSPYPRLNKMCTPVFLHFTIVHKSNESEMVDMTTFPVFFLVVLPNIRVRIRHYLAASLPLSLYYA